MHASAPMTVQAKLKVNKPGDLYEQEADRIADRVMRMPDPHLQRACACGGKCAKCRAGQEGEEQEHLQTKQDPTHEAAEDVAPALVHEVLHTPGQPLDPGTRAFFEPRFGHDFSQVRVHTDAKAAQSAASVGALAYTVGRHIVFAEPFKPRMASDPTLLAHELVHVVQQGVPASDAGKTVESHGMDRMRNINTTAAYPRVQRQAGGTGTEAGAYPAATGKCYTCDIPGGVGICCYAENTPMVDECFELAKGIIDRCTGNENECLRQAQCAQCQCIGQRLGEQYCQCTGIV